MAAFKTCQTPNNEKTLKILVRDKMDLHVFRYYGDKNTFII